MFFCNNLGEEPAGINDNIDSEHTEERNSKIQTGGDGSKSHTPSYTLPINQTVEGGLRGTTVQSVDIVATI